MASYINFSNLKNSLENPPTTVLFCTTATTVVLGVLDGLAFAGILHLGVGNWVLLGGAAASGTVTILLTIKKSCFLFRNRSTGGLSTLPSLDTIPGCEGVRVRGGPTLTPERSAAILKEAIQVLGTGLRPLTREQAEMMLKRDTRRKVGLFRKAGDALIFSYKQNGRVQHGPVRTEGNLHFTMGFPKINTALPRSTSERSASDQSELIKEFSKQISEICKKLPPLAANEAEKILNMQEYRDKPRRGLLRVSQGLLFFSYRENGEIKHLAIRSLLDWEITTKFERIFFAGQQTTTEELPEDSKAWEAIDEAAQQALVLEENKEEMEDELVETEENTSNIEEFDELPEQEGGQLLPLEFPEF